MAQTNDIALVSIPVAGDEIDTLIGALERNRRTFAWKCGSLGPDHLRGLVGEAMS
jgi:hypothetical protein